MALHDNLRALRAAMGIGQAEVAGALEVSIPAVSDWETGKKAPSRKNLLKLADFYGVSIEHLHADDLTSERDKIVHQTNQAKKGSVSQDESIKNLRLVQLLASHNKERRRVLSQDQTVQELLDRMEVMSAYEAVLGLHMLLVAMTEYAIEMSGIAVRRGEGSADARLEEARGRSAEMLDELKTSIDRKMKGFEPVVARARAIFGGQSTEIPAGIEHATPQKIAQEVIKILKDKKDAPDLGEEALVALFERVEKRSQ